MSENRVEVKFSLSGADLERLVVVGSDLEYLRGLRQDRLLTHTEVRLAASVLRRLFIDQQLQILWKRMGAAPLTPPTIEATEIDTALKSWTPEWIRYAWAGGAVAAGAHHTGFILAAVPKEEHEQYSSVEAFLEANPMPMTGTERRLTLDSWLRSTSVAIRTNEMGLVIISRASVIKYMANRKGGVHFDHRRRLDLDKPWKRRLPEIESHLLDHGLLRVGHLSGPEFEVASMVQAVAATDWSDELVRIAEEVAPQEFSGDPHEMKFWTGLASDGDGTGWATTRFGPKEASAGDMQPPLPS